MHFRTGYFLTVFHILLQYGRPTGERCFKMMADCRDQPGEMDLSPGTLLNLFTNLTVSYSGILNSVMYYARREGSVYISFWNLTQNNSDRLTYNMLQKVLVNATGQGLMTVRLNENIEVTAGSAVAIHYPDTAKKGVIYYGSDKRNYMYQVINSMEFDNGWTSNKTLGPVASTKLRAVSLHLNICEIVQDGPHGLFMGGIVICVVLTVLTVTSSIFLYNRVCIKVPRKGKDAENDIVSVAYINSGKRDISGDGVYEALVQYSNRDTYQELFSIAI